MTLGEKLKKLRTDQGLTQEALGEKLFVSRTAISKWESDRGYPNIETLKAISKFFSVSVDDLLSSDELLTIAQEDGRQKETRLKDSVFALLDLSMALLLFLPFFAGNREGIIQSVSLVALDGIQTYLKAVYFVVVTVTIFVGVLALTLQNCQKSFWLKSKTNLSLLLGMAAVLLFVVSSQPYAAVFAIALLTIKIFMLIRIVPRL